VVVKHVKQVAGKVEQILPCDVDTVTQARGFGGARRGDDWQERGGEDSKEVSEKEKKKDKWSGKVELVAQE
jgi:hypothetical protein